MVEQDPRNRLRGPRLVAAPLVLVGVVGTAIAVATVLWSVWHADRLGGAFAAVLAGSLLVGIAGFAGARGCFVEPGPEEIRDVVGWVTLQRIPRARVVQARVRAGAWRWFELELDDGRLLTLLGASPAQLPTRLLPSSVEQDLADLAALGSPDATTG